MPLGILCKKPNCKHEVAQMPKCEMYTGSQFNNQVKKGVDKSLRWVPQC